jgi:hypothetical protein
MVTEGGGGGVAFSSDYSTVLGQQAALVVMACRISGF